MEGWMDGWMEGRESGVKDCLQQSKITFVKYRFANLVEKKREEFKKARKRMRTSSKCPFSHLLSTNKISYSQKAESIIEKKEERGRINDICYFGCFLKNSKITQSKEEHITKICQI